MLFYSWLCVTAVVITSRNYYKNTQIVWELPNLTTITQVASKIYVLCAATWNNRIKMFKYQNVQVCLPSGSAVPLCDWLRRCPEHKFIVVFLWWTHVRVWSHWPITITLGKTKKTTYTRRPLIGQSGWKIPCVEYLSARLGEMKLCINMGGKLTFL